MASSVPRSGEVDISLLFAAVLQMVVLHQIDGRTVTVNPAQVTALYPSPPSGQNKLITKEAHCAVWLADGKFLSVTETCDQVKAMLEAGR